MQQSLDGYAKLWNTERKWKWTRLRRETDAELMARIRQIMKTWGEGNK